MRYVRRLTSASSDSCDVVHDSKTESRRGQDMTRLLFQAGRPPRSEAQAFFREAYRFPLAGCIVLALIVADIAAAVAMLATAA
jgi:hypothetical protein